VEELEAKAQTVFTGRSETIRASSHPTMCTVDGCLHKATKSWEVTVKNNQLAPISETHLIPLCDIHSQAGDTLKWEWRRTADAPPGRRLTLETLFAVDSIEDRPHP
jgi:hypothetical protein